MGMFYHGLRALRGFQGALRRLANFLRQQGLSAYLESMSVSGRKATVFALVGALAWAGLTPTGYAATGKIDAFVVRQTIRKDLPKINRCYESALRYEPDLAGKVKVRFAIVRKGHVVQVRVLENTTGHPGVERCVARVVGAIRFPSRRSGKALSFTFPFVFAPQR